MKWTHWVNDWPKSMDTWSASKSTNTACFNKGKVSMKKNSTTSMDLLNIASIDHWNSNISKKTNFNVSTVKIMRFEQLWHKTPTSTFWFKYNNYIAQDYTYMMGESHRAKKLRGSSIPTNQFCIITVYYFLEVTLDSTITSYLSNFVPLISLAQIKSPSYSLIFLFFYFFPKKYPPLVLNLKWTKAIYKTVHYYNEYCNIFN